MSDINDEPTDAGTASDPAGDLDDGVRVLDVITTAMSAELRNASPHMPMRLDVSRVQPKVARPAPGQVVFSLQYCMLLRDSRDRRIAEIKLTLTAPCLIGEHDDAWLANFTAHVLVGMLHDYLREHLYWLTGQMGLPPLLIEVFRPTAAAAVTRVLQEAHFS